MPHFGNYNPASFGWTVDRSQIVDFTWKGQAFPAGAHRLAVPVFTALLNDLETAGGFGPAGYENPGDWGYEYRPVTGNTSGLSFHAYGTAIDVKAPANPYVASGYAAHSIVDSIAKSVAKKNGCEWGGGWTSPHDYMHFELHLDPDEASAFHGASSGTSSARPTLHQGSTGSQVATLQRRLNLTPSTKPQFGPVTTAAVKMYQARHKLAVDGIVGAATWSDLLTAKILPGERTVQMGDGGADVSWLQRRLWLTPAAHPQFGPITQDAVKTWQGRNHLTADGIVGPATWQKLGANG